MKTKLLQLSFILTLSACNSGGESGSSQPKETIIPSTACANQKLLHNYDMENAYYTDFGDALYFNDDCTGYYEVCRTVFTYTPISQTINNANGNGNGSYFTASITESDDQIHGCPLEGNYECVAWVDNNNVAFILNCHGTDNPEEILLVLSAPNGSNYPN